MAATTPATVLIDAHGVSDPMMFHPGLDSIQTTIDFSVSPVDISEDGANQEIKLNIPKSFVAIGAYFESDADKNGKYPSASGTITLKVGDTTAGADKTIGATFTPSNSAYKRQTFLNGYTGTVASTTATITGGPIVFDNVDATTGKLPVFITLAADQLQGKVKIGVFGFVPNGDGLNNVVSPADKIVQPFTNVAGTDPWQSKNA